MGHPVTDVGATITHKAGLAPISLSAGASNGGAINRSGMDSCKLILSVGAATGSPTGQTADCKLQDSADGSTGWADYTDPSTSATAAVAQILDTDDAAAEVSVNLRSAKKFIRTVTTIGFTAGTTPAIVAAPSVILGGARVEPAVAV